MSRSVHDSNSVMVVSTISDGRLPTVRSSEVISAVHHRHLDLANELALDSIHSEQDVEPLFQPIVVEHQPSSQYDCLHSSHSPLETSPVSTNDARSSLDFIELVPYPNILHADHDINSSNAASVLRSCSAEPPLSSDTSTSGPASIAMQRSRSQSRLNRTKANLDNHMLISPTTLLHNRLRIRHQSNPSRSSSRHQSQPQQSTYSALRCKSRPKTQAPSDPTSSTRFRCAGLLALTSTGFRSGFGGSQRRVRVNLYGQPIDEHQLRRHRLAQNRKYQFQVHNFLERPRGRKAACYHIFVYVFVLSKLCLIVCQHTITVCSLNIFSKSRLSDDRMQLFEYFSIRTLLIDQVICF